MLLPGECRSRIDPPILAYSWALADLGQTYRGPNDRLLYFSSSSVLLWLQALYCTNVEKYYY